MQAECVAEPIRAGKQGSIQYLLDRRSQVVPPQYQQHLFVPANSRRDEIMKKMNLPLPMIVRPLLPSPQTLFVPRIARKTSAPGPAQARREQGEQAASPCHPRPRKSLCPTGIHASRLRRRCHPPGRRDAGALRSPADPALVPQSALPSRLPLPIRSCGNAASRLRSRRHAPRAPVRNAAWRGGRGGDA